VLLVHPHPDHPARHPHSPPCPAPSRAPPHPPLTPLTTPYPVVAHHNPAPVSPRASRPTRPHLPRLRSVRRNRQSQVMGCRLSHPDRQGWANHQADHRHWRGHQELLPV
jgi:hypothetical protein